MRPVGTSRAALAEYGTLALEFIALSQRTNNAIYGQRAIDIIKLLHERYPKQVRHAWPLACWAVTPPHVDSGTVHPPMTAT